MCYRLLLSVQRNKNKYNYMVSRLDDRVFLMDKSLYKMRKNFSFELALHVHDTLSSRYYQYLRKNEKYTQKRQIREGKSSQKSCHCSV